MILEVFGWKKDLTIIFGIKKIFLHKLYFKIFKKLEFKILNNSDYLVCLTNSIKPYLNKKLNKKIPIEIIPCCADYDFF